jgi:hypothetical protein
MDQELKRKYDSLPGDLKRAIDSTEVPEKIRAIATKNGLHIDKIGILEEEVGLVMLGSAHMAEFVDRIEERLSISTEKAMDITTQVNLEIFLPIRESLMKISSEEDSPQVIETSNNEQQVSRDTIMAEIENPTPMRAPITVETPGPARPREIITTPQERQQTVVDNFIASKLSETVSIPSENIKAVNTKIPEKPKGYSADPYREPIA